MFPTHVWGILYGMLGLSLAGIFFLTLRRRVSTDHLSLMEKIALPLIRSGNTAVDPVTRKDESRRRQNDRSADRRPEMDGGQFSFKASRQNANDGLETLLLMTAMLGDYAMIVTGFFLANLFFPESPFSFSRADLIGSPTVASYKLILVASAIMLWRLRGKDLYLYKSFLTPSSIWPKLMGSLGLCLLAFIGVTFLAATEPRIGWKFIVWAALFICPAVYFWRLILSPIARHPALLARLRRRVVVIGGGAQAVQIQTALEGTSDMEFVGWVQANKPNHFTEIQKDRLGSLHELRSILRKAQADIAVLVESESLQREGVLAVAKDCEIEHVQFKMSPHFFEILVSSVRPENIAGMELLGAHCLPLHGFRNRVQKRTVDILGALVGLGISIPVMAVLGAMVYRESPGPIFYRQIRQGRNGRLFSILKLRSMRMNAEEDGRPQWAQENDHRRLSVGAFMRKWNLDEIPQFWNVLRGQMSLVGPRPERPELIAHFKSKIPHYQARHMYQPGMTGWAQVNGWRGNTSLEERIRHDIWYLEHWSVWLDFRIMMMTFSRNKNAY